MHTVSYTRTVLFSTSKAIATLSGLESTWRAGLGSMTGDSAYVMPAEPPIILLLKGFAVEPSWLPAAGVRLPQSMNRKDFSSICDRSRKDLLSCSYKEEILISAALAAFFQADAPQGWEPRFSSEQSPDGRPTFEAGSIITVDYVPTSAPIEASPDLNDAAPGDTEVTHRGATSAPSSADTPSLAPGQEAPNGEEAPRNPGDDVARSAHPEGTAVAAPSVPGVFLILAQDYTTELVEARVPVDTQPAVALLFVSQARNRRDQERFPILCAVEPQPLGAQALLLALPLWAPDGAIVAFDLTGVDGRLFALQIGRRVTRAGLLQAAELPDDPHFDVFVGTMPWAIPPTTPFDIRHGDLVRGPSIVSSFADMLRSDRGWNPDLSFIRAFSGWNLDDTWVLNEDRPFLLHVSGARRRYVRQDLAFRLRIPVDELILCPPQPRAVDFSHRGWVTCNVLFAARSDGGRHYAAARDPICFIDSRPILRGLRAVMCCNGRLDLQGLYTSVDARCPPGFRAHLWYGQQEIDVSRLDLNIEDGAVITATFLPAQPQGTAGEHGPPDDGFSSPHNDTPPGQGPDGDSNIGPGHATATPPSPDAGTGSARPSSPADAPAHYLIAAGIRGSVSDGLCARAICRTSIGQWDQGNMCRLAFNSHHALPEGKQARTPVTPVPRWHLGLCAVSAVCMRATHSYCHALLARPSVPLAHMPPSLLPVLSSDLQCGLFALSPEGWEGRLLFALRWGTLPSLPRGCSLLPLEAPHPPVVPLCLTLFPTICNVLTVPCRPADLYPPLCAHC